MKKTIIYVLICIGFFCGCKNSYEQETNDDNVKNLESFILHAKYQGKEYYVPCKLDNNNDSIIFLDQNFKDLFYNEISRLPNLVCTIKEDSCVEYSNEIIDTIQSGINIKKSSTRERPIIVQEAYLRFWDDTNYHDRNYRIDLNETNTFWKWPSLKFYNNFNDKISALKIYNNKFPEVTFLGYEDNDYKGDVLRYTVSNSISEVGSVEKNVPKLKNVPKKGGGNWNDKISSIHFYISKN